MRRPLPAENSDQSERRTQIRKQTNREHSIQTFSPQKDIDSPNNSNLDLQAPKMSKMDRVNGIDLKFIFKKRGHSPETSRLRTERFKLLQPNRTRDVEKSKENEQILEYRPSQQDQKEIEKLNILIYNRLFYHCEKLGTTPLREFNENIHESWLNTSSDNESQISHIKTEKCPTNILKKCKKHESINLEIRLKQTAKQNILPEERNEETAETIKGAERDFSMDLPLLVEETA